MKEIEREIPPYLIEDLPCDGQSLNVRHTHPPIVLGFDTARLDDRVHLRPRTMHDDRDKPDLV